MKHSLILKRAWKILWDYKALWIFGVILAVTTTSLGGNQLNYSANNNRGPARTTFARRLIPMIHSGGNRFLLIPLPSFDLVCSPKAGPFKMRKFC